MAGPLVPQNASASFAQQGSVDWVELSNRSVHFSVAVLARLSKAGVDPLTLQVGKAVCFNLSLESRGQQRISDAILKLKKYSSYGNLIWFGFGVKHIVTDLAESEEGLTLIALCAALTSTYESLFAARVLRELCILCKAPLSFTPALRQWKALVELCAGILTSSHFELVLSGFHRLILSPYVTTLNPEPSALAKAILILGEVSRKKVASAVFRGDLNCAWVAAFAEWVLSLKIAISTSNGDTIYRSQSDQYATPQVSIVTSLGPSTQDESLSVQSKTSIIPGWDHLLYQDHESHSVGNMGWRCDWTNILYQTFGGAVKVLLGYETGGQFRNYIYSVSLRAGTGSIKTYSEENSRGHRFLEFASRRLPELRECLQGSFEDIDQDDQEDIEKMGLQAYMAIGAICTCSRHSSLSYGNSQLCLNTLAEVIVIFLWITLATIIDDEIYPSITGMSDLYERQYEMYGQGDMFACLAPVRCPLRQTELVFHVLSGLSPTRSYGLAQEGNDYSGIHIPRSKPPRSRHLALVGAGICVYHYALENPNLPSGLITKLRCVRGYVAYSGAHFKDVRGLSGPVYKSQPVGIIEKFKNMSIETIVQENENETQLEMAYQLRYTDSKNVHKRGWLNLVDLFQELYAFTRVIRCTKHCSSLFTGWSEELNINYFVDRNKAREAQQMIAQQALNYDTWFVTSAASDYPHSWRLGITAENYFSIYLTLALYPSNPDILGVFPAIRCLSCIFHFGCMAETATLRHRAFDDVKIEFVTTDNKTKELDLKLQYPISSPFPNVSRPES